MFAYVIQEIYICINFLHKYKNTTTKHLKKVWRKVTTLPPTTSFYNIFLYFRKVLKQHIFPFCDSSYNLHVRMVKRFEGKKIMHAI